MFTFIAKIVSKGSAILHAKIYNSLQRTLFILDTNYLLKNYFRIFKIMLNANIILSQNKLLQMY